MVEKKKPDCVLSDGREINIDLTKCTLKEWREYTSAGTTEEISDLITSKITGIPIDELTEISILDWKLLMKTISEVFRTPLANPTSPGA